jgi:hypothetical protein
MAIRKPKRLTAPTWSIPSQYTRGIQVGGQGGVAGPYDMASGLAAMGQSGPGLGMQYKTPNWAALIAGDPDYGAAQSEMTAMNAMDRGSLRDAIRRAVIESGLQVSPDEDIDQGTLAAAAANQFSTTADIGNQLRRGTAQSDAELASRGLLSSGQFTENRSVLQRGADTARNSLQNALLNTIASGRQQYASTVADRAQSLRGIRESIAARLAQNPGIWQTDMGGPAAPAYGAPAAAIASRPIAAPKPQFAEGTIDGAGHVFRNGRWQPIGGAPSHPPLQYQTPSSYLGKRR